MSSISWYLESIYIRVNYYGYQQHGTWQNLVKPVADIRRTKGTELDAWSSFVLVSLPFGRRRRKRKTRERERERTVHRSALTRVPPRATLLEYWTKSDRADYSHLIRLCLTPNLPLFFRWLWSQLMPFTLYEAPFPVWIGKPKKG